MVRTPTPAPRAPGSQAAGPGQAEGGRYLGVGLPSLPLQEPEVLLPLREEVP